MLARISVSSFMYVCFIIFDFCCNATVRFFFLEEAQAICERAIFFFDIIVHLVKGQTKTKLNSSAILSFGFR